MTYTDLEKTVFNAMVNLIVDEPHLELREIKAETGLEINTIKGVVGSLTKKGLAHAERERHNGRMIDCLYPIFDGEVQSFACDDYEDVEEFKI